MLLMSTFGISKIIFKYIYIQQFLLRKHFTHIRTIKLII